MGDSAIVFLSYGAIQGGMIDAHLDGLFDGGVHGLICSHGAQSILHKNLTLCAKYFLGLVLM